MEQPGFVSDLSLPRMLHAVTIRSPAAKGRLISIRCSNLPVGYTLITARDIPGKNRFENTNMPVLADEELSYIGEPVALLMGPDKNTLEECAKNCMVNVREEYPVFSIQEPGVDAIAAHRETSFGDCDTAFAEAASVVSNHYRTGIQEHWYAEPTGAAAWPLIAEHAEQDAAVSIAVCTATQWPYHVKRSVAQVLGLPDSAVQVQPSSTGLHMDGRFWYPSLVSCHAALGAWICKRPVRLILTRGEDFSFSPKRSRTEIYVKNALDVKGKVTGTDVNAIVNLGAFGVNAKEHLDNVYLGCMGVYKTKNIRFSGTAVKTNIPPQGPFAGFGIAEGVFAMERQASCLADVAGQDPALWRKENISGDGFLSQLLPSRETIYAEQLVDAAMKMSDYRRKWASYELLKDNRILKNSWSGKDETMRGIGIALGYQGSDLIHSDQEKGGYGVELILDKEGFLEIKTGMVQSGCSFDGIWAGVASEILGVDAEKVRISRGEDYPDSGPSTASRNITVITSLVEQACLAIRKKRFRDPLPIAVRKTVRPVKNTGDDDMDLSGFAHPGCAAAVVEVAIDPVEFVPEIRGIWLGVDGGKIICEDNARRSLRTSVIQALGWAFREQIHYVNGVIPADQFENFYIPGPSEIPPVSIDFISNGQDEPKGIGDLPFGCVPAAYLQAVSQAMDFHFHSIPLKSLDVWYALVRKRKEGREE